MSCGKGIEKFGCSGGRVSVLKFRYFSPNHRYHFYRNESFWLRKLGLTSFQYRLWDLEYAGDGEFHNTLTGNKPMILHLPGSKKDVEIRLNYLQEGQKPNLSPFSKFCAVSTSSIAYVSSFFQSLL